MFIFLRILFGLPFIAMSKKVAIGCAGQNRGQDKRQPMPPVRARFVPVVSDLKPDP
jgi:hypothetical protein